MLKQIKGYENRYAISDAGELVSLIRKMRVLVPCVNKIGYVESVLIDKDGKRKNHKWHRLVATAFIPNKENKPMVNHKNGIRTDNRVSNLEWCTHKENINHAIDVLNVHLGQPKGKFPKHLRHRLKLSVKSVAEIKQRLSNGEKGIHIARAYGVSDQTVYDVKNERCWKTPAQA